MNVRQQLKQRAPLRQWLLLGACLVILGGLIGWDLWSEHKNIDRLARERLTDQVKLIDENLARQLNATNLALDSIRNDLQFLTQQGDGNALLNLRLRSMSDAMLGVRTLIVFDRDGTATASNRKELIGQNFREREYFRVAREGGVPATLYVSPPFKNVLGVFALTVVKIIPDDRGEFAGLISATLDPEYFATLLKSVLYAPDMRSALIHGDGKIAFRVPDPQGITGMDLLANPGNIFNQHMSSGQATSLYAGTVASGEERLMVLHTIRRASLPMDKPLVIAVSRELPALFAPWRESALIQGGGLVVLILASTLGLYFHQQRQRTYARLEANRENERKEFVAALSESEQRFRSFVENINDVLFVLTPSGVISYVSPQWKEASGYELSETIGRSFVPFVHADDVPVCFAFLKSVVGNGEKQNGVEFRVKRKNGTYRWNTANASVVFDIEDGTRNLVGIARDITEREQAETKLRVSEDRFRKVVEYSPISMALVSMDGIIEYINHRAVETFGYLPEDIPDMEHWWTKAYPNESYRSQVTARWMGMLADAPRNENEIPKAEYRVTCKNGGVRIVAICGVLIAEKVLVIFEDITEIKAAEQQRKDREAAHRRTLVREVHHRIKNNLQSVSGLLRRELGTFVELNPRLETAIAQVDAIAVVHGMQGTNADGVVHLSDLARHICDTISTIFRSPVHFYCDASTFGYLSVERDESVSLALVLNELVLNAAKHSTDSGLAPRVRLSVDNMGAQFAIRNAVAREPDFDIGTGKGVGTGLSLVRSLLPENGAHLTYHFDAGFLTANLTLSFPVVLAIAEGGRVL